MENIKKRAKKIVDANGEMPIAHLDALLEVSDKLEELKESLGQRPETQKVELMGAEIVTIKGKKGDKGDKGDEPDDERLISLIEPLIPAPMQGEKGDNYVLTAADKKQIAKSIKVPVVEKIIEKVETFIEKPIITNEIKEVAIYETPDQIIDKVNSSKKNINLDKIDNLSNILTDIASRQTVSQPTTPRFVDIYQNGESKQQSAARINFIGATVVGNGSGADVTITGGTGNGHIIEDEGTPLIQRADLNFVGAGVAVTDVGGKTTVTIPGVSSSTPTGTGFTHITAGVQDVGAKLVDTADINANQVTNAKLAQMATKTYKGRTSALTGDAEDVAVATLKTDLALTKSDVGLSNVDNTSDVNKPVSTAQATADGVVQAFTIQRANHTGTQLASTISDFASTVRATVLTGISFATGTAVTAADSILVAIGKLQAQNTTQDTAIALNTAKVTNATHTGDATGATALTLATVNSNVGSFTNANITVNAKGLVTAASNGSGGASGITIGTTTITSGTTTRVLYNNAGAVGEYTVSGSGNIAMTTSPVFTTPNIGTATGSVSGNAGTATALTTARTIGTLTGDITTAGSSFDGTGNNTNATVLATVNSNVGAFGSATQVATFTVNAKGLTTAAANVTITPAVGSITGLGTGVATALAVNVGTAGAPVVNGGALGTPSSGTVTNLTGTASGLTAGAVTGFTAGAGVLTGPAVAGVAMTLANAQTVTGAKTFNVSTLLLAGSTSGTATLNAPAVASTYVYTAPSMTTTLQSVGSSTETTNTATVVAITGNNHIHTITALAAGNTFGVPTVATGALTDMSELTIRIKDNGTARTLAWNAIFRAIGITLPTTTVISKTMYVKGRYNFADTKWDMLAYGIEA